jgi:hypothetical protein
MKRVAVFGNAGGGKSTLSRRLAGLARLPLYRVDTMQWTATTEKVPHNEYFKARADLLRREEWIINAFGDVASAWSGSKPPTCRPAAVHALPVRDQAVGQRTANPEGWPEEQSDVEQHDEQLPRHPAMPPRLDAEVSPGCRRRRGDKARSSLDVGGGNPGVPRRSREGVPPNGISLTAAPPVLRNRPPAAWARHRSAQQSAAPETPRKPRRISA